MEAAAGKERVKMVSQTLFTLIFSEAVTGRGSGGTRFSTNHEGADGHIPLL